MRPRPASAFPPTAVALKALRALLLAFLIGTLAAGPACALPQGGSVAAGQAAITQTNASTLVITQLSDKAIINWRGFNIDTRELVRFLQPSAGSTALNRVNGGDPSIILGALQANGRIFLINPAGIVFGGTAKVDVGGLLATTLNMKDSDFLAGRYVFQQQAGGTLASVVNEGSITAAPGGFVVLVAPGVVNKGTITAQAGAVHLASGQQFTVDFAGDGLIKFAVDGAVSGTPVGPDGKPLDWRVSNAGKISAAGGSVTLTAKAARDVLAGVVNNSGVIEARSLVDRGGTIVLSGGDTAVAAATSAGALRPAGEVAGVVVNTGTLDVSAAEAGAAPGRVLMIGERVGQSGTIDARGASGSAGGTVIITSTDRTVLGSGSTIDVSGTGTGSAGTVRVWSDNFTAAAPGAQVLARGGESGGDGGFVEVSGRENLQFGAFVDTRAPQGKTGTLLLDPKFIVVQEAGGDAYDAGNNNLFANNTSGSTQITPSSIDASATNVVLQANTDITVVDPIATATAGVGVTMQAGRSIAVNADVSTNNGAISLTANDPGASLGDRDAGAGSITMAPGTTLSSGGGDITLRIGNLAGGTPGDITARTLATGGGNVLIDSRGAVALNGAVSAGAGTVTINANTAGAGASGFTMNAGSSITTTSATGSAVAINVNAAAGGTGGAALRDITTGSGGTITVATDTGGNTTGGSITQAAGTLLNAGSGTVALSTPTGGGAGIGTVGANILTQAGTVTAAAGAGGVFVTESDGASVTATATGAG
ncbi:MAG: filamentous hemagglutinin N-terminal domain-containing protein, partial [Candidatus Rokubacteria bacterium]|nr:filamentous hemagglutinin N-terminal domain-containing protein [Candidatus Rokubacteria bacterium]